MHFFTDIVERKAAIDARALITAFVDLALVPRQVRLETLSCVEHLCEKFIDKRLLRGHVAGRVALVDYDGHLSLTISTSSHSSMIGSSALTSTLLLVAQRL